MPGPRDLVLAPLRAVRLAARALDDLNALAERARRDPDPVEEVRVRLDMLLDRLGAVIVRADELVAAARAVQITGERIHDGGEELTAVARELAVTSRRIVARGEDLVAAGDRLHVDTRELIAGGGDLTAAAERIEASLAVFRAAMPRLMAGLDTVEELEGAVETVAETVEPLQGAAERVGRLTDRFSRSAS